MKNIRLLFLILPFLSFAISCSDKVIDNQKFEADRAVAEKKIITDYVANNRAKDNNILAKRKTSKSFSVRGFFCEKPDEVESNPPDVVVKEDFIVNYTPHDKTIYDWKTVDKECRVYIAPLEKNIYAYRKVHQASAMTLDLFLLQVNDNIRLKGKDRKELKEAIAFHTDRLVEMNTFESGILAKSLKQLKGFWSKEKIEEVKKFGLAQSEKFSEYRKGLRYFDEDLLDDIENGGRKALKDL